MHVQIHSPIYSAAASLCIGETVQIGGRSVSRIGLCGDGAYVVDGRAVGLEAVHGTEATAARSAPIEIAVVTSTPVLIPRRARTRVTSGSLVAGGKPIVAEPEILVDTRDAVLARRSFRFVHRRFDGGEAVTVAPVETMTALGRDSALRVAMIQIRSSGLHVEYGTGAGSLVVAASVTALHPVPKPTPKSGAKRPPT